MLNRLFLGKNSTLDTIINIPPDKFKLYLSLSLQNRRPAKFAWLETHKPSDSSKLTYTTRKEQLKIYYSNYPVLRFSGILVESEGKTRIKGIIGEAEWGWWFQIIWIGFFAGMYLNWLMGGNSYRGIETTIYFALFGFIALLFRITLFRKKTLLIKREIENFVSVMNNKVIH